jgi:hypothetical protein
MAFPPKLYAVLRNTPEALAANRKVVEIRRDKLQELETKKATDRANELLDPLEEHVAQYYETEIRLLCEQQVIARGVFSSAKDLARKLMPYIRGYSRNARSFKWSPPMSRNRM